MAGIGDLVAHLGLDNSGFKKGLASSRSLLSSFAGGVAGLISPLGAAFAGLAGVAGIGALVKGSFETVDALSELGSTMGMSASQMAGWAHAAELSSLSTEELVKGVRKLATSGVDIFALADQIAAVTNPAEQARMAIDALGESGAKFLPLLQGGSASIREMVNEGSKLSGLEGLDATKVEAANDAITRAQAAVQGLGNMFAVELAPWVESVAKEMQSLGMVAMFMFQNLGDYGELAWTRVKLGAVSTWESIWHLFTEQIPAALSWFGENWNNVWNDLLNRTDLFIQNLGKNIGQAMSEIWDYIVSGGKDKMELAWVPLQQGFIRTIEKLPEIPERALSELEMQLQAQADAIGEDLGNRLAEKLYGGMEDGAAAVGVGGIAGVRTPGAQSKNNGLKAALAGSSEAASILLRGKGGKSIEQIAEKQLAVQQQTLLAVKTNKPQQLQPLTL